MIRFLVVCLLLTTICCAPAAMVEKKSGSTNPAPDSAVVNPVRRECAPCIASAFFLFMGVLLVIAITQR